MAPTLPDILKSKYPAKAHARKVAKELAATGPRSGNGLVYLESQKQGLMEDSDAEGPFRQRRAFFYLSGCLLADSAVTYAMEDDVLTLYIPSINPEDVMWSGLPLSLEEAKKCYDVDRVRFMSDLDADLSKGYSKWSSEKPVFAIDGRFTNKIVRSLNANASILDKVIDECRVSKDEYEVALIRYANEISNEAHTAVMKAVKMASSEQELLSIFIQQSIANGAMHQAYNPIVASGTNSATLHYVKNDLPVSGKQLLLLDAGAEYNCYASDITRTFPINGAFTKEARQIYDIVLRMQKECLEMMKPGVLWDRVHEKAHQIAIEGLLEAKILKGNAEDIFKARTSVAFFPHGLGHYLGMDTHDTGGHPNYSDQDSMFRYLRVRRNLSPGDVITVEPGVYFCEFIIAPYLKDERHAQYIDEEVLNKYWDVGGVRIEDNVLITEDGISNLTTVPKEVEDMLKLINHS